MAIRMLTPEQMAELCRQVHPDFRVIVGNGLTAVLLDNLKMDVTTIDSMLSGMDFQDMFPRRMLERRNTIRCGAASMGEANKNTGLLLQERGQTHGDYTHMSIVIQQIKNNMRSGEAWCRCSAGQREALELIATKIGRIVCGDPNHHDHWADIVGYATKAMERIEHKATC